LEKEVKKKPTTSSVLWRPEREPIPIERNGGGGECNGFLKRRGSVLNTVARAKIALRSFDKFTHHGTCVWGAEAKGPESILCQRENRGPFLLSKRKLK